MLMEEIEMMQQALEKNQSRQLEIEEEMRLMTVKTANQKYNSTRSPEVELKTRKSLNIFCVPYFKDQRLFSHPPNSDTLRKRSNNELDNYIGNPKEWNKNDKKKLIQAVKEDALRQRMKSFLDEKDELIMKTKNKIGGVTELEKESVMQRLRELKLKIDEVCQTPEEELFHNRDEDFDWMRIAASSVSFEMPLTFKVALLNYLSFLVS